jgi:dienelactone hydrolase
MLFSFLFVALVALSGAQPAAAETIRFKSIVLLDAKWSATVPATLTLPTGTRPHPAVIFMHPCGGLAPLVRKGLRAHADFFVRHGFATLVPDSFGARGLSGGKACADTGLVPGMEILLDDAFSAMAALQKNSKIDGRNIFLVGQSLGGAAALKAALKDDSHHEAVFRAIAAYYPGRCRLFDFNPKLRSGLIIFAAGRDDWTPFASCQAAKNRKGYDPGAHLDVIVYPDALHAFDQPGARRRQYKGHTLGYNAEATADSQNRMLEFFKRHLASDRKS